MRKIFIVLFILLSSISFLFFHDKGNDFLRPYFAKYLENKLLADMQIEVSHLKIDLNHIEFHAILNEFIDINAEGEFSLFTQTLNIDYTIQSNLLKNKIDINGTFRGTFNNLNINGKGEIVQSKVNYQLNVKDDLFSHIKIKINKADIASFLELTAQPTYATGKVDVNVDIENLEKQTTNTNPQIVFHETILNQKIFKEAFDLDLPSKTVLTAKLNAKFTTKTFQVNGVIKSEFATLKLSKSYYNRRTKELSSDYTLLIPRLSKLPTKQKLRGSLEVIGAFQRKNSKVYLIGKCKDFGGRVVFNLKENQLNVHMNGVDIEKISYLFGEKPYVRGKLMADIELHDFKQREGTFNFKMKEAEIIASSFRKELNLNFEKSVCFLFNAKGDIGQKEITMEAQLDSDILKYTSSDIKYKFSSKALSSTYLVEIPKLSKLNSITGKKLKGELSIHGELNHENEMIITGNTQNLGGNIDFKFKAQKLNAKINNIEVKKLMETLSYPQVFKAKLFGDFNYDFARSSGRFTSRLKQAELLNTYLTQVIKEIRGTSVANERYAKTYFNATFHKHLVNINFKAQSKRVLLSIPSGQINQVNNKINAYYKVEVDKKKLEGRIMGDLSDPKISLDSSKYIQNNMMGGMMGGFFN
jgi:hypothetical protein